MNFSKIFILSLFITTIAFSPLLAQHERDTEKQLLTDQQPSYFERFKKVFTQERVKKFSKACCCFISLLLLTNVSLLATWNPSPSQGVISPLNIRQPSLDLCPYVFSLNRFDTCAKNFDDWQLETGLGYAKAQFLEQCMPLCLEKEGNYHYTNLAYPRYKFLCRDNSSEEQQILEELTEQEITYIETGASWWRWNEYSIEAKTNYTLAVPHISVEEFENNTYAIASFKSDFQEAMENRKSNCKKFVLID